MSILYTDNDPFVCAWLKNLIEDGQLHHGDVLCTDVRTLQPKSVAAFQQQHYFAGIGGWPLALKLAGWPDDWPIWTGSCPCQPFSTAGKRRADADDRDIWPAFYRLVAELRPRVLIGEQVEAAIALGWLDRVFADLEGIGYASGAVVLPACSVGAPHIRQRLFWMGIANCSRSFARQQASAANGYGSAAESAGSNDGLALPTSQSIYCRDGKWRRIPAEPALQPLANDRQSSASDGVGASSATNRAQILKGAGNAIVIPLAVEFIKAVMDVIV